MKLAYLPLLWVSLPLASLPSFPLPEGEAQQPSAKMIEERERAPDGHRGFGETTLKRAAEVVQAKSKDDESFIQHLRSLSHDLELFLALQAEPLRKDGIFKLAGLTPKKSKRSATKPGLRDLFRVFEERQPQAIESGHFDKFTARMQANTRLRLLKEVLILSEWDAREIQNGLAFLLTHREGWGDISLGEAQRVAARIDRAAARSRARTADLELLFREDTSELWTEREETIEKALLLASKIKEDDERLRAVDEALRHNANREQALRTLLASPRMREQLATEQQLTESRVEEAARSVPELRELLPGTEEAQKAPKVVTDMSAQDRHGRLSFLSRSKLGLDPLNEDLNWLAGVAIDFLSGEQIALKYFDRYLALRGIRSGRGETHLKKKLTPEEQRALDEVQRAELPLGR